MKNLFFKIGHTNSYTSRVFKRLCKNVGKIDTGSRNFLNCDRILNINVIKTLAKACSNKKFQIESEIIEEWVENLEQGSNNLRKSRRGSVSKNNISCSQKRWKSENSKKFEAMGSVYTLPTFQNGAFALPQRRFTRKELHLQTGFGRYLFLSPIEQKSRKCEISLERQTVQIHIALFWPRTSTRGI